mmetsp:Transcript_24420/g.76607  ORF Transcript_24420/g.76607 Transcript_24420/m.76607 type:complete len:254 (-) Transcript_24420:2573-3334(-)
MDHLAPFVDHLSNGERIGVACRASANNKDALLNHRLFYFDGRQRGPQDLSFARVLRKIGQVGTTRIGQPLLHLHQNRELAALPRTGIVQRDFSIHRRRHEADFDTAQLAKIDSESSARDAAVHGRCDRQLGQLQDRAVDRMHRRSVTTTHSYCVLSRFALCDCLALSAAGLFINAVEQLAQDGVVLHVHWTRVEACGEHLLLQEQHVFTNVELFQFFILHIHHLFQLVACAKSPRAAIRGSRVISRRELEWWT